MSAFPWTSAVSVLLALIACVADEPNQTKIIGHWEVVKSIQAPTGSAVEFTKDGKLILLPKGKEDEKLVATYTIEGKTLRTKRRNEENSLTIQTLNDTTLITRYENGDVDELKRVSKK